MREKTFHVYVDSHDRSLLLQSLRILWMVWGGMAVFAIVLYFFERKAVHATYHDGYDASAKGRVQLAEHIRKLPLGFLMSKDSGEMGNTMMNDFAQIEEAVTHVLRIIQSY